MTTGPLDLVAHMAAILDELEVPYALGGSLASSLVGEPRSTVDVDIAIQLGGASAAALLERCSAEFYVPRVDALAAIRSHSSFHLVDTGRGLKVDLFVLGPSVLDRMQIERRVLVEIPGLERPIWITSAEDQVLRKLDSYRASDHGSNRQWRDIVGILRLQSGRLDLAYLEAVASEVGLSNLLSEAMPEAGTAPGAN